MTCRQAVPDDVSAWCDGCLVTHLAERLEAAQDSDGLGLFAALVLLSVGGVLGALYTFVALAVFA